MYTVRIEDSVYWWYRYFILIIIIMITIYRFWRKAENGVRIVSITYERLRVI